MEEDATVIQAIEQDQHSAIRDVNERLVIASLHLQELAEMAVQSEERLRALTEALQLSILYIPPEDSFPGLKVTRFYEAASDDALVGGDFSDIFACNFGHVALILGDVMGHGLPAAMFTAELKFALRGFVREHVTPGRIMAQMNLYLSEGFRLYREGLNNASCDSPLCLVVAIIDTGTGEGLASAAGMEYPLLVRSDGSTEELNVGGLLLGIDSRYVYEEMPFHLASGDTLVLTTDGVTEARHAGVYLGYEGLKELAHIGWKLGSLQSMGSTIVEGSRNFADGLLRDDVCILLAQQV